MAKAKQHREIKTDSAMEKRDGVSALSKMATGFSLSAG